MIERIMSKNLREQRYNKEYVRAPVSKTEERVEVSEVEQIWE